MNDELQKAKATVARYRSTKVKATPAEYMAYMRAVEALAAVGLETLTAGQRGFMAAARSDIGSSEAGQ
jgi:hypothetical protein